ncbi:hypothetical protein C8Q74DRAFT_840628 [Fomes fomentarius]|nr:hypothetical protein C8Q74DRAFT_840628 [Fomes fomentarius]
MTEALNTVSVRLWHCNWRRCPETFRQRTELMAHLHAEHWPNILTIKKTEYGAYLRCKEGQSGATISLPGLSYPSSESSVSESGEDSNRSYAVESAREAKREPSPLPFTPPQYLPPLPRTRRASGSTSNSSPEAQSQANGNEFSPMPPPSSAPRKSSADIPPAKRRRIFASHTQQSSPMSTPSVDSVPPSPALTNMITDAINRSGELNAVSPHNHALSSRPLSRASTSTSPFGVAEFFKGPRRTSNGASPTPNQSHALPALRAPIAPLPLHASTSKRTPTSPDAASVGSAQAVEDALTQSVSYASSLSQVSAQKGVSDSQSSDDSSSLPSSHKQSQHQDSSDMQPPSYCGSHAVEPSLMYLSSSIGSLPTQSQTQSQARSPRLPEVHVEPELQSQLQASSPPVPSPLPRIRRARSKTPAAAPASQSSIAVPPPPEPPMIGRVLRSRSKTPAPAPVLAALQSKAPPPLPRRSRSRASSSSNAGSVAATGTGAANGNGGRAGLKPSSTRRAGSIPPSSSKTTESGVLSNSLATVPEQPAESSQVSQAPNDPPHEPKPALAQAAFRSGKLRLPRRTRTAPQEPQQQPQEQARLRQTQSHQPMRNEMTVKPEPDTDAMDVDPDTQSQSQGHSPGSGQTQSQSQDAGGYREGYGFDLGGMQLMTQRPYPSSQSQGWS